MCIKCTCVDIKYLQLFNFMFNYFKIIPGSESRSVEAICWQGLRLFSAGLDGNVTEYDLKKLKPKVHFSFILIPSNDTCATYCINLKYLLIFIISSKVIQIYAMQ